MDGQTETREDGGNRWTDAWNHWAVTVGETEMQEIVKSTWFENILADQV